MANLPPTTELQAVNIVLDALGEAPVSTLSGIIPQDATNALAKIRTRSRALQQGGWTFNTDYSLVLTPSTDGYIYLPTNTLNFKLIGETSVTVRGSRFYDNSAHTFFLARDITVDLVSLLPFEELPEPVRGYIAYASASEYKQQETGEGPTQSEKDDLTRMWFAFKDFDVAQAAYSLSGSKLIQKMKKNRPRT